MRVASAETDLHDRVLRPREVTGAVSVILSEIFFIRLYFLIFFGGRGHVSAGFCLWVLVTPFASCFYVLFISLFSNFLFVFCDLVYLINLI